MTWIQTIREVSSSLIIERSWKTNVVTVSCVVWPKYTLDNPQNIVHNVNVTNLAYIEPDIYRANGIAFLNANMETVFGR